MSKIEFRIFFKEINGIRNNKIYPALPGADGGMYIYPNGKLYCDRDTVPFREEDYVLMRKSSWRDIKGKPIYEGDVVTLPIPLEEGKFKKFICRYGAIAKNINCFSFFPVDIECFYFEEKDSREPFFPLRREVGKSDLEKMEIIGNIYENPEYDPDFIEKNY